jgi:hypothetical protein
MQEQMDRMQKMLREKKKTTKVSDVDLFSRTSCSSLDPSSRDVLPPVKTNPFAESSDRQRKQAKTFLKTPNYGPGLSEKTTRVLRGEEKEKLLERIGSSTPQHDKMVAILRDDLADSSDEEAQRNPMEERYNSYGKEIKRISSAPRSSSDGQITSIGSKGTLLNVEFPFTCALSSCTCRKDRLQPDQGRHLEHLQPAAEQAPTQGRDARKVLPPEGGQAPGGLASHRGAHVREDVRAYLQAQGRDSQERGAR